MVMPGPNDFASTASERRCESVWAMTAFIAKSAHAGRMPHALAEAYSAGNVTAHADVGSRGSGGVNQ